MKKGKYTVKIDRANRCIENTEAKRLSKAEVRDMLLTLVMDAYRDCGETAYDLIRDVRASAYNDYCAEMGIDAGRVRA